MIHAAQKYMKELLQCGLLIPLSEDIRSVNVVTPALPSSYQVEQFSVEETAYHYLLEFFVLASELRLPINNPIAFFHEMLGKISVIKTAPEMKSRASILLQMVYADCSFLFGSSFDSVSPQRNALRAADLLGIAYHAGASNETKSKDVLKLHYLNQYTKDEGDREILCTVLGYQSQLISARRFEEDYPFFRDQFKTLEKYQKIYQEWKQKAAKENIIQIPFHITREKGRKFFEIYKVFSLQQCTDKRQFNKLLKQLEVLEKELQTAFVLSRILFLIDRCINRLQNPDGRLYDFWPQVLSKLVCLTRQYFKENEFRIRSLVFSENMSEELKYSVDNFLKVIRNPDSEDKKEYPTFFMCAKKRCISLSQTEKDLINDLKSHALIKCIMKIQEELCKLPIQEVSAFYLFKIFNHAGNIRAPFTKSSYKYKASIFRLESMPMSEESTAVRNQKSAIYLFNALEMLCYAIFPNSYQEELCDYLFERCRGYVPHGKYIIDLAVPDRIYNDVIPQYKLQYAIDQQLRENLKLDVMCFQQYAFTQCTAEDFYQFFFHPDTSEDKKVLKQIDKSISKDKFDEYCQIALYSTDGYGNSHHPLEWHKRMSKFMDDIIDANDMLCQYVDGDSKNAEEIYVGNGLSFDTWNDVFCYADGRKLDKGQFLTNHARVQLAIHAICLKRAAEVARKEALQCYKHIFFDAL